MFGQGCIGGGVELEAQSGFELMRNCARATRWTFGAQMAERGALSTPAFDG